MKTKNNTGAAPVQAGSTLTKLEQFVWDNRNRLHELPNELNRSYRGIMVAFGRAEKKVQARFVTAIRKPSPGATCPTSNGAELDRWESLQAQLRAALEALTKCREAVTDGSKPPSARMELVRDYATPVLVAYATRKGGAQ